MAFRDTLQQAQEETLPRIREEAGWPPGDEPATGEQIDAYIRALESTVVGQKAAMLTMRNVHATATRAASWFPTPPTGRS
jgi:hypothetical protein